MAKGNPDILEPIALDGQIYDPDETDREIINVGSNTVKFEIAGSKIKLKPGQITSVHKAYATSRAMQRGRDPVPSVVELETGFQVYPITHPKAQERSQIARDRVKEMIEERNKVVEYVEADS